MPQRSPGADRAVRLWDYWSRAMRGNEYMGIFPGDPAGVAATAARPRLVDLCLELSKVVRKNNPGVKIEVATWADPLRRLGRAPVDRRPPAGRTDGDLPVEAAEFPPACLPVSTRVQARVQPASHGGDSRPSEREP